MTTQDADLPWRDEWTTSELRTEIERRAEGSADRDAARAALVPSVKHVVGLLHFELHELPSGDMVKQLADVVLAVHARVRERFPLVPVAYVAEVVMLAAKSGWIFFDGRWRATPMTGSATALLPAQRTPIVDRALQHSVAFILEATARHATTTASGTLVAMGGSKFILTARHVYVRLKESGGADIVRWRSPKPLVVAEQDILPVFSEAGSTKLGPDIALLGMPGGLVDELERDQRYFHSLDRARARPFEEEGLWLVMGAPLADATLGSETERVNFRAIFSGVRTDSPVERDGWDYVDAASTPDRGHPESWAGMSGGGLWQDGGPIVPMTCEGEPSHP